MITLAGNFSDYNTKVEIKIEQQRGHSTEHKPSTTLLKPNLKEASMHDQIVSINNSEKYNMMMVPRQFTT
jgi:hypothetical protein